MNMNKKEVRKRFRTAVFERDGYKCKICGFDHPDALDAHHITDRNEMPNGGYVSENGITLCTISCHQLAEEYHRTGEPVPGYSPKELYELIGSSKHKAVEASKKWE